MQIMSVEITGYGKCALVKVTDKKGTHKYVERNENVWRYGVAPYRYRADITTVNEPAETLYSDRFCDVAVNKWFGIFCTALGDYKLMSVPVARFIANRLCRDGDKALKLVDALA